jgi:hypothetical protein
VDGFNYPSDLSDNVGSNIHTYGNIKGVRLYIACVTLWDIASVGVEIKVGNSLCLVTLREQFLIINF